MPIRCEIVSQDRVVFSGDADIVVLPGVEGEMGILPNHAPLLTALRYGIIVVRKQGEEQYFTVAGGVAEVQPDQVTVLADAAENVMEINVQRAEAAKRRAEERLKAGVPQDSDEYFELQAALRRSNLRLEAVQRYRQRMQRERRE
ncbi:F0F1 ATP synthase subunit epsilon [Thermanaerothrix sp. 4228-RoL]|jgi:F-type H+-transporting ATPase subunit epsilon|uniref:ATP synthase epsilon chain n=1 Tax=Thermanaerothrix solaris TaxID=3058434 RepID=A0ABU3NL24_9CHLR|nr:F0F1 ATP synthase subunit epsilon [Thermanaerothrix sp. 4228-RoL]MDT8897545.1 F0F1 ATP synthase subunit epsilon [Thermanaerothrix sp. 4228-RoL]